MMVTASFQPAGLEREWYSLRTMACFAGDIERPGSCYGGLIQNPTKSGRHQVGEGGDPYGVRGHFREITRLVAS